MVFTPQLPKYLLCHLYFGKLTTITNSNISSVSSSLCSLSGISIKKNYTFWNCPTFLRYSIFILHSLWILVWEVSIDLVLRSLILSSVVLSLLTVHQTLSVVLQCFWSNTCFSFFLSFHLLFHYTFVVIACLLFTFRVFNKLIRVILSVLFDNYNISVTCLVPMITLSLETVFLALGIYCNFLLKAGLNVLGNRNWGK